MKDRHVLLAVVGILSTYVVIHTGMSGFALYLIDDALRQPELVAGPYEPESRAPFAVLFLIMLVLSWLSVASFAAFWHNLASARKLWLAFSCTLLVSVALAVFVFQVSWTHYLFEVGAVAFSWLCLHRVQTGEHAE
jgi:hypothetical protein